MAMSCGYAKAKRAAVIAVSAAVTLAACLGGSNNSSSSATPSPAAGGDRLTVDRAASFIGEPAPAGSPATQNVKVGAIFTNHSQRRVATSISVEATAYGRDNATVIGRSVPGAWSVSMVHAGQSLPVAITIDKTGGGPISRVSFHTPVGAWFNDTNPKRAITGRNLTLAPRPSPPAGSSEFNLKATVFNGYPRDLQLAPVSAICEDQGGKIISAGWGYVGYDILPANGEEATTIQMDGEAPPSPESCQAAGRPASALEGG